jgi:hypothetical protein
MGAHVIFGWLQIGDKLRMPGELGALPEWARTHPHAKGTPYSARDALYIARDELTIGADRMGIPGGGVFNRWRPELRLTAPDAHSRSLWELPGWFYPDTLRRSLSYHGKTTRWTRREHTVLLSTVGRGQEFVLQGDDHPELELWLRRLFALEREARSVLGY